MTIETKELLSVECNHSDEAVNKTAEYLLRKSQGDIASIQTVGKTIEINSDVLFICQYLIDEIVTSEQRIDMVVTPCTDTLGICVFESGSDVGDKNGSLPSDESQTSDTSSSISQRDSSSSTPQNLPCTTANSAFYLKMETSDGDSQREESDAASEPKSEQGKKYKKAVICSSSEGSGSPSTEDTPVRRSSRIKSLVEKKEKQSTVKTKAKKNNKNKKGSENKLKDSPSKTDSTEDLSISNESSPCKNEAPESPNAADKSKSDTDSNLRTPVNNLDPNLIKKLEDEAKRPEKVKSRWRRNSELERVTVFHEPATPPPPPPLQPVSNNIPNEVKHKEAKEPETIPEKLPVFENIDENIYLFERKKSKSRKEVKRMLCDCTLTKEEKERGCAGCMDDCLNRLLMIECGSRCLVGDACANRRFVKKQNANIGVFKTDKKGWGLKALEDIDGGTFIMEYVGEVLSPIEFNQRVKLYAKEKFGHYYFMALKGDEIIDATLKGNCSRFINHSCDPNCETQKWTVNGELRIGFFTNKSVKLDEELTFDYQFQRYGREAQRCYCESSKCRGFIGESGEDKRIALKSKPSQQKRKKIEEKKKEELEDLAFEEELKKLSSLGGLKNREQTLMLARLMVRGETQVSRQRLLEIIQNTTEQACLRLFLDYHGLTLLWSWMVDLGDDTSQLKSQILQVLAYLPIHNKTMLIDSKIMSVVQKWATQSDENSQPATPLRDGKDSKGSETPDTSLSGSNPPSGATTPCHGDDEVTPRFPPKRLKLESDDKSKLDDMLLPKIIEEDPKSIDEITEADIECPMAVEIEVTTENTDLLPQISEPVKELAEISEPIKELAEISEPIKELPQITEPVKELPQISESVKELPEISESVKELPEINEPVKDLPQISEPDQVDLYPDIPLAINTPYFMSFSVDDLIEDEDISLSDLVVAGVIQRLISEACILPPPDVVEEPEEIPMDIAETVEIGADSVIPPSDSQELPMDISEAITSPIESIVSPVEATVSTIIEATDSPTISKNEAISAEETFKILEAKLKTTQTEKSPKSDEESQDQVEEIQPKLDIATLANSLLSNWTNLKEVFRIPRLEHQKRMEDERAAGWQDREYNSSPSRRLEIEYLAVQKSVGSVYERRKDRSPRGSRVFNSEDDFYNRYRVNHMESNIEVKIKKPALLPKPKMSKEQRRQLFALEVQQRDLKELLLKRRQELAASAPAPYPPAPQEYVEAPQQNQVVQHIPVVQGPLLDFPNHNLVHQAPLLEFPPNHMEYPPNRVDFPLNCSDFPPNRVDFPPNAYMNPMEYPPPQHHQMNYTGVPLEYGVPQEYQIPPEYVDFSTGPPQHVGMEYPPPPQEYNCYQEFEGHPQQYMYEGQGYPAVFVQPIETIAECCPIEVITTIVSNPASSPSQNEVNLDNSETTVYKDSNPNLIYPPVTPLFQPPAPYIPPPTPQQSLSSQTTADIHIPFTVASSPALQSHTPSPTIELSPVITVNNKTIIEILPISEIPLPPCVEPSSSPPNLLQIPLPASPPPPIESPISDILPIDIPLPLIPLPNPPIPAEPLKQASPKQVQVTVPSEPPPPEVAVMQAVITAETICAAIPVTITSSPIITTMSPVPNTQITPELVATPMQYVTSPQAGPLHFVPNPVGVTIPEQSLVTPVPAPKVLPVHIPPTAIVSPSMVQIEENLMPPPATTVVISKPLKLPHNWKTAKDAEGNTYFYHALTRQTQWDPPEAEENEESSMDLGTPTFDEPKRSKRTTTAPADTSSELAKRIKEIFRLKMSSYVVQCLNPFRKPDCKFGRISGTEDFKHLARKLTHFVMAKELKHCKNVEDLECNENVKHKAKDFVHKYMGKFGSEYKKDKHSPRDY